MDHYDFVPPAIAEKIAASAKHHVEDTED
jgi:hypothetical protein